MNPGHGRKNSPFGVRSGDTFPLDVHLAHVDAGFSVDDGKIFGCIFKTTQRKFCWLQVRRKALKLRRVSLSFWKFGGASKWLLS